MPTQTYFDLRDALALPGCPVCRLRERYLERVVEQLLYEHVNDQEVRERLRASRGFCREHAWYLARQGAALGVALILRDVLGSIRTKLAAAQRESTTPSPRRWLEAWRTPPQESGAAFLEALDPEAPCPLCLNAEEIEGATLRTLRQHLLADDGLLEPYAGSDGLCRPHLRQALAGMEEESAQQALVEAQLAIWQRLDQQLGALIVKNDYRFQREPLGEEADAWRRVIAALSGEEPRAGKRE